MLRLLTAATTSVALLVLTALPALAAAGTKPTPGKNDFLIGSMEQLVPTAIVGIVLAILAFVLMPADDTVEEDHH